MNGYAVARLDEIEEMSDGRCPWRPVRHHFGITSFGVNTWTGRAAGDRIINEHDESGADDNEELYLVQRGRATFELDGERVDAPAGTFVFARPGVKRTAFAEEPGTTIVALGGTPGKAYEPFGWEIWAPCHPLYDAGKYAEAVDCARELVEAHPEYAGPLYNLACCESLAGRTADAVEHLRLAIERSERFRSLATGTPTSTRSAKSRPSESLWLIARVVTRVCKRRPLPSPSPRACVVPSFEYPSRCLSVRRPRLVRIMSLLQPLTSSLRGFVFTNQAWHCTIGHSRNKKIRH
jgi:tetratricopeptide (TPR) repeat protein